MVPILVSKDGKMYLNDIKRYAKGTILVPTLANRTITMAAGAYSAPIPLEGPIDAVNEIMSLMAYPATANNADVTARMAVLITDEAYRRQLMNREILCNQVFGNGLRPFRLMESVAVEGQQVVTFQFHNVSLAGGGAISFSAEAQGVQGFGLGYDEIKKWINIQRQRKAFLSPYWLTSDAAVSLLATQTKEFFFTNTSDKWLLLGYVMAQVITQGSLGDEAPEFFEFEIYDAKTQRKLMNQPITMNTGTGTAQFPFRLDDPLLVEPSTQLRVRMTSLITNAAMEVFLTFHGVACSTQLPPFAVNGLLQPATAGRVPGY
jgi:hypothetical protein